MLKGLNQARAYAANATSSGESSANNINVNTASPDTTKSSSQQVKVKRTSAQLDDDLRRAMERLAGDGGEAGIELEDGKPVAMKRGVRENMFRLI